MTERRMTWRAPILGAVAGTLVLAVLLWGGYGQHWSWLLAFAALVVVGYTDRLSWTGFPGNTLWDWLELLLLPFVVPALLVPAALRWITTEDREQRAEDRGQRTEGRGQRHLVLRFCPGLPLPLCLAVAW